MNYIDGIDKKVIEYFKILEPEYPEWLNDYINTESLLKTQYISVSCGTIYSDLFDCKFFYSSLEHSIAVALIVWHFTHDKKQTIAGLFHDIATPSFKHCVDFLDGDYMNQESTEDLTSKIIADSEDIMKLLKRDGIKLSEIDDYHIYPIADNDTPKLAADRLEYSLSNALLQYNIWDINNVREIYDDIYVQKNEEGIDELGFKTKKIAREFVKTTSIMSVWYRDEKRTFSMQFIADVLKRLNADGKIKREDLYNLGEKEVIDIIQNSKYKDVFDIWKNAKELKISKEKPEGVYSTCIQSKVRYINPLVNGERIYEICKIAKRMIDKNLAYKVTDYAYLDFNF